MRFVFFRWPLGASFCCAVDSGSQNQSCMCSMQCNALAHGARTGKMIIGKLHSSEYAASALSKEIFRLRMLVRNVGVEVVIIFAM
jgi:hypothetical protein